MKKMLLVNKCYGERFSIFEECILLTKTNLSASLHLGYRLIMSGIEMIVEIEKAARKAVYDF